MKKDRVDMLIESYLLEDAIESDTPVISLEDYDGLGHDFVPMSPMLRELVGTLGGAVAGGMMGGVGGAVAGGAAGHLAQKKFVPEDFDLLEDNELCEGEGCGDVSEGVVTSNSAKVVRKLGSNTGKPIGGLVKRLSKVKEEYGLTDEEFDVMVEQLNPELIKAAQARLISQGGYAKKFTNATPLKDKFGRSIKNAEELRKFRKLRAVNNGIDLSEEFELEDFDLDEGLGSAIGDFAGKIVPAFQKLTGGGQGTGKIAKTTADKLKLAAERRKLLSRIPGQG